MARHAKSACARLKNERGAVTMMELLASIPVMVILLAAVFMLYNVSVREQRQSQSRVENLVGQKNGLERISRELRDAEAIEYQSSEVIDAQITENGRWVRFDCSGTSCRRLEGPSLGIFDTPPSTLISGVEYANFQLLTDSQGAGFQPDYVNPTYVTLTLKVDVDGGDNPIQLEDGFNLRNLTRPE
jgi:hypothetical protein